MLDELLHQDRMPPERDDRFLERAKAGMSGRIPGNVRRGAGHQRCGNRRPRHARQRRASPHGQSCGNRWRHEREQRLFQDEMESCVEQDTERQVEPEDRRHAVSLVARGERHEKPEIRRDAADDERRRHREPAEQAMKRDGSRRMGESVRHAAMIGGVRLIQSRAPSPAGEA